MHTVVIKGDLYSVEAQLGGGDRRWKAHAKLNEDCCPNCKFPTFQAVCLKVCSTKKEKNSSQKEANVSSAPVL